MRTPAERHLIDSLRDYLLNAPVTVAPPVILNIGAGRSTVIEQELVAAGCSFVCDRIDIEDCSAELPVVRNCLRGSVEKMTPIESGTYSAAFANYVLEHVADLDRAASEISRVLKPGGIFLASVPNLTAPEFVVARHAPARFQKMMTHGKGFKTYYSWKSISDLTSVFESHDLVLQEVRYYAFTQSYLLHYPVVNLLSRLYDRIISASGIRRFMGNVCIKLIRQ
jgi:SAM-dependent methyltransferase